MLAWRSQLLIQHSQNMPAADHADHLVGAIHHRVDLGLGGQHLLGQTQHLIVQRYGQHLGLHQVSHRGHALVVVNHL